jgi:DNA replication and repair protein RecF
MLIEEIRLKNFRNFADVAVSSFSDGLNLFLGPNGSGKTNLLEAISLSSLAKSCRGALDSELVRLGQKVAIVEIYGRLEKKKSA